MVFKQGNFVLCKKQIYWFYREDKIPDYADPCDLPEGYEVVLKARNNYPFLKRINNDQWSLENGGISGEEFEALVLEAKNIPEHKQKDYLKKIIHMDQAYVMGWRCIGHANEYGFEYYYGTIWRKNDDFIMLFYTGNDFCNFGFFIPKEDVSEEMLKAKGYEC